MSIFSERTSTLMHQYGLNQKDLAKMAGVTESAMSYYIKGERTPRSDVLTRIAKALNTTTDYLLGITNTSAQSKNKELHYLQRNLEKLDPERLKKGEKYTKSRF